LADCDLKKTLTIIFLEDLLAGFADFSPALEMPSIESGCQLRKSHLSLLERLESGLFVQQSFPGAFDPDETISLLCPGGTF
jgi:hypothetical protein